MAKPKPRRKAGAQAQGAAGAEAATQGGNEAAAAAKDAAKPAGPTAAASNNAKAKMADTLRRGLNLTERPTETPGGGGDEPEAGSGRKRKQVTFTGAVENPPTAEDSAAEGAHLPPAREAERVTSPREAVLGGLRHVLAALGSSVAKKRVLRDVLSEHIPADIAAVLGEGNAAELLFNGAIKELETSDAAVKEATGNEDIPTAGKGGAADGFSDEERRVLEMLLQGLSPLIGAGPLTVGAAISLGKVISDAFESKPAKAAAMTWTALEKLGQKEVKGADEKLRFSVFDKTHTGGKKIHSGTPQMRSYVHAYKVSLKTTLNVRGVWNDEKTAIRSMSA